MAARRAGALLAAGVKRGDRVAIMSLNRSELLETILACGWIGAAAVPINGACMGPQIEYLLVDSEARLLVIEGQYLDRMQAVDWSRTKLHRVWVLGEGKEAASPERWPC